MDAVEYVKQCRRMIANNVQIRSVLGGWSAEAVVEQVEQWAKEHPVKTRQSEFLKMYPNAVVMNGGVLCVRPCDVDNTIKNFCKTTNCGVCRRDFWLTEIKDGET